MPRLVAPRSVRIVVRTLKMEPRFAGHVVLTLYRTSSRGSRFMTGHRDEDEIEPVFLDRVNSKLVSSRSADVRTFIQYN